MIIPFEKTHRAPRGSKTAARRGANAFRGWEDGSYVVGILDGVVVGATPLANGLRLIDPADLSEVLAMLAERLPAEFRDAMREELLEAERRCSGARCSTK